jgi:hypothetical protein
LTKWLGSYSFFLAQDKEKVTPHLSSFRYTLRNLFFRGSVLSSFIVILVLMVFSYLRFVHEEIAPFFPLYDDQGYYLRAAHEYFDYAQKNGFFRLLKAHFTHNADALGFYPASSLHMSLLASFLFPIFGTARIGALSILLLSWSLLLATAAFVFNALGKSWNYSALVVRLFLSAGFGFVGAGGMFDFRMDFPAACWSGIAMMLWCLFIERPSRKYAAFASLVTFGLFFCRILTLTYWSLPLCLILAYVFIDRRKKVPKGYSKVFPSIGFLAIASLILLFWDRIFILNYYFTASLLEAPIRNLSKGLYEGKASMFLYYFRSLWGEHLGYYVRLQGVLTCLAGVYLFLGSKVNKEGAPPSAIRKETFVFVFLTGLWPLIVLTNQPNHASQVTGILVPPVIVGLGLLLVNWTQAVEKKVPQRFRGLAFLALITGFFFWEQQLVISTPFQGQRRIDAIQFNSVLQEIALHELHPLNPKINSVPALPQLAVLDWVDGFNHNSVTLYDRERLGIKRSFEMELPRTIFKRTDVELLGSINKAKAIIVPRDPSHLRNRPWPVMQSIQSSFPQLLKEIRGRMVLAKVFKYGEFEYELFLSRSTPL